MTQDARARRAVAIGGGTGLPAVLGCLLDAGFDTTAVVTMADDGGSSGSLRRQLGVLPPGDVRNCLVAMADEPEGTLARLFQYRFSAGEGLAGHALGNLVLAALNDLEGSFADAIEAASALLGVRGRVLPSTLERVWLSATDAEGRLVTGQANVAHSETGVDRIALDPPSPAAYPPALDALREADTVVVGPGSLYTSLLPNFLIAGMCEALRETKALKVYVCNVANQRGETHGMDAADHVDALVEHGLEGVFDVAIVHRDGGATGPGAVAADEAVLARIAAHGLRVVTAALADAAQPLHHDRAALCAVLGEVLGEAGSGVA